MKNRASWLLIPALALSVGACKKNEVSSAPDVPAASAEAASGETAVPPLATSVPVPKLSAEERAAKLGFAKFLPQDTEVVMSFHNGSKAATRIKSSKLWNLIAGQLGGGMLFNGGMEMPEEDLVPLDAEQDADATEAAAESEEDAEMGAATLFGQEFTLALGAGSGEQFGKILTFYRRMGYYQMRTMAKTLANSVDGAEISELTAAMVDSYGADVMGELIKDPEAGLHIFEDAKMPPVYVAFKTDPQEREAGAQLLAATLANLSMLGEMVEPIDAENSGHKFSGFKVLGEKISATMAEDRDVIDADLGTELGDRLLALVAEHDWFFLSGNVGDYAVIFVGSSLDDLKFAPDAAQSLAGTEELAFSDAYASKELAALIYGEKDAMNTLITASGGLVDMTNGLRDGLSGTEGLGDTRDLEAMFQIIAEREEALRKLSSHEASGVLAYFEDGLKIEVFGGTDSGMLDWDAPRTLGHLGDSEDVVLFANSTTHADYNEKASAYLEALLETSYAMYVKIAEAPLKSSDIAELKKMVQSFDTSFRSDLVGVWEALRQGSGAGLGEESALVMDLKGSAPAVPGIPQKVLDEGRIPRISWVAPVKDRTQLAGSWDATNRSLTGVLAKFSEIYNTDIPMQKPISSERDGSTSWFIAMPFLTDDFLPSITVSDEWFAASTSKNQALDLIGKAKVGGASAGGLWFSMNFKALQNYVEQSYQLMDAESEAWMGEPLSEDQKKMIENSIQVLSDLDKMTVHARREGGVPRTSIHLKTR